MLEYTLMIDSNIDTEELRQLVKPLLTKPKNKKHASYYQPLFHFDKMSFFIIGICLIKYFTWIRDWIFSLQNIVTLTGPPGNIIVYRFYN